MVGNTKAFWMNVIDQMAIMRREEYRVPTSTLLIPRSHYKLFVDFHKEKPKYLSSHKLPCEYYYECSPHKASKYCFNRSEHSEDRNI